MTPLEGSPMTKSIIFSFVSPESGAGFSSDGWKIKLTGWIQRPASETSWTSTEKNNIKVLYQNIDPSSIIHPILMDGSVKMFDLQEYNTI